MEVLGWVFAWFMIVFAVAGIGALAWIGILVAFPRWGHRP